MARCPVTCIEPLPDPPRSAHRSAHLPEIMSYWMLLQRTLRYPLARILACVADVQIPSIFVHHL